jgi:hypothetical protein
LVQLELEHTIVYRILGEHTYNNVTSPMRLKWDKG